MNDQLPLVITISRQPGSGGLVLGSRLAKKMDMMLVDRQIIEKTAEKMGMAKENLEDRDERVTPRWQSILNTLAFSDAAYYTPPEFFIPADKEIFKFESNIIQRIACENAAVIIGRGGGYILRNRPHHLSIYLHAGIDFRRRMIQEQLKMSEREALAYLDVADKSRARYIRELTGHDMNDARQYHLSIDTGTLGLDGAEKVISAYLKAIF